MNKSESVPLFQKLLQVRASFKSISQLSWSIAQLEKRYPLDALPEEEITGLLEAYREFAKELNEINDELKREINDGTN